MIEINLLPGSGKKARGRSFGGGFEFASAFSNALAKVKDPYLIGSVGAVGLSIVAGLGMFTVQKAATLRVEGALQTNISDSMRFAGLIKERRKVEAQRATVLKQLEMIRTIDDNRYTWPHIMDEVSRALPQYTWLISLVQTSAVQGPTHAPPPIPGAPRPTPPATAADSAKARADSLEALKLAFRITGQTVDLQALTRFMKQLEASPFIENVQLLKSATIIVDEKDVTEFQLDAQWEKPGPGTIRTEPIAISVR